MTRSPQQKHQKHQGNVQIAGSRVLLWIALGMALTACTKSTEQSDTKQSTKEQQQKLVQMRGCASCHGVKGQGNLSMKGPKLAGQSQEALAQKLKAYRSGEIKNPTMAIMAYNLTDEEVDVLAAYFSQFP